MDNFGFSLLNQPRTFTHFSKYGSRPSIIVLTFATGQAPTIAQYWHCDPESGSESDHALTEPMWNINPPSYIPRWCQSKCDWLLFEKTISVLEGGASN